MRYRIPGRPWFKPLRLGAAPQPVRWEGWAFTACYVAGIALFAEATGLAPPFQTPPEVIPFLGATALLTLVYSIFAWLKSEERTPPMRGTEPNIRVKRVGERPEDKKGHWL